MRFSKFITLTTFVTCLCLLYVYQQTEIFHLAYIGQKKSSLFHESLDKNTMLRYNINRNTSLVLIDGRIAGYANFEMPGSFRVVKLAYPEGNLRVANQSRPSRFKAIAISLFGLKTQAEAKTIDHP